MKPILLVAHDSGGANNLAAGAPALRAAGHHLAWAAGGPAMDIWRAAGEHPVAIDVATVEDLIARTAVDLILTGTSSVADLERRAWAAARRHDVGSLAVIDAWMNHRRRVTSEASGELILPDAFAVADAAMRQGLLAENVRPSRIHVVGQPHLEALAARLAARRLSRSVNVLPLLVFVSEHIFEERSAVGSPGYDQFTVASMVLQAFRPKLAVDLTVLPHPSEGRERWTAFLAARRWDERLAVTFGGLDRDTALTTADGVIGMTSMVLLEASLVGVPTLSLQPDRVTNANPMIDLVPGIDIVTSAAEVPIALERLLAAQDRPDSIQEADFMQGAAKRLAEAVGLELDYSAARRT